MSQNQDDSQHEGEEHRWRNGAISVAVVGAIIAAAFYSNRSPALQQGGIEPSSAGAAMSADVCECIRVKRIEIVGEAGTTVGVLQSTGTTKDRSAMLELYGYGTRAGRFVRIDPQEVLIASKEEGAVAVSATSAEWTVKQAPWEDDVMVRIAASPQGGAVYIKPSH